MKSGDRILYIDATAGREYRERIAQEAKVVEELEGLQAKAYITADSGQP